jgi:glycerate kinase
MKVEAGFAWLEKKHAALIEMASASGITLLTNEQLNPMKTTTYGTGQLIKAAIAKQPDEILLAIGGSATIDMGVGAAMALGWQFLDSKNQPIGLGGEYLEKIEKIIPPADTLRCRIKVLSDVSNPLYGPNGAAEIFGPQKGANPRTVKRLDTAIKRLAEMVKKQLGIEIADIPGAGAAGGLGAGTIAFMNAEIVSGIETIINITNLKEELSNADWIITGEGRFDSQSLNGKVISGIIKAAKQTNTKIAVIAGDVKLNKSEYENFGISAAVSLKKNDMTTEYAMRNCEKLLKKAAYEFISTILGK